MHTHVHTVAYNYAMLTSVFPVPLLSSMISRAERSDPCRWRDHFDHQIAQMNSKTDHQPDQGRLSQRTPVTDQIQLYQSVANNMKEESYTCNYKYTATHKGSHSRPFMLPTTCVQRFAGRLRD